ncbi:MAG: tetratricopeptide repeat protein [Rhodomicrobium sp.]
MTDQPPRASFAAFLSTARVGVLTALLIFPLLLAPVSAAPCTDTARTDDDAEAALLQSIPQKGNPEEAIHQSEKLVEFNRARDIKETGKPGRHTAEAYSILAWHLIRAHDFTKSLAAIDQAIAFDPDDISNYARRATALMFLNRTDEAKAIFLDSAYKGKTLRSNVFTWEESIATDFDAFRRMGLTHPLIEQISTALSIQRQEEIDKQAANFRQRLESCKKSERQPKDTDETLAAYCSCWESQTLLFNRTNQLNLPPKETSNVEVWIVSGLFACSQLRPSR